MLTRFRNLSYVLAYAVATIPLWHYIRDGRILALMGIVVAFAYLNVVLSTVDAAQPILSSEKSKVPLPRWLPDKPKYHKWWMLIRRTLKWHLLLIPPKMGLALGFVHWLHLGVRWSVTQSVLRPYFYTSHFSDELYPQWETILLATAFVSLFTCCEMAVVAALGFVSERNRYVLVIRILLGLSIIGTMSQYQVYYHRSPTWNEICSFIRGCPNCSGVGCGNREAGQLLQQRRRIGETIEIGFLILAGFDVLQSANIMRPVLILNQTNHADNYSTMAIWDNRPFVARQIVAGIIGLLLYTGATWLILWFVEDDKPPETA